MTTQPTIDQAKTEAFLGKVLSDTSGMTTTILASIGDRLGLFTNFSHMAQRPVLSWRTVPISTNATHANGLAPWRVRAT